MTTDNDLRASRAKRILIDSGSQGNLVLEHVVKALHARVVRKEIDFEMASGERARFSALVWLIVSIEGVQRVIAAVIVNGEPDYTLLLGRHWMSSVGLRGDYGDGTYTIRTDEGVRVPVYRSITPTTEREGVRLHRVATHPQGTNPAFTDLSTDDYEADTESDSDDISEN